MIRQVPKREADSLRLFHRTLTLCTSSTTTRQRHAPHMLLEEIGAPYQLALIDRATMHGEGQRLPEDESVGPHPGAGRRRAHTVRDGGDLPASVRQASGGEPRSVQRSDRPSAHSLPSGCVPDQHGADRVALRLLYPDRVTDDEAGAAIVRRHAGRVSGCWRSSTTRWRRQQGALGCSARNIRRSIRT